MLVLPRYGGCIHPRGGVHVQQHAAEALHVARRGVAPAQGEDDTPGGSQLGRDALPRQRVAGLVAAGEAQGDGGHRQAGDIPRVDARCGTAAQDKQPWRVIAQAGTQRQARVCGCSDAGVGVLCAEAHRVQGRQKQVGRRCRLQHRQSSAQASCVYSAPLARVQHAGLGECGQRLVGTLDDHVCAAVQRWCGQAGVKHPVRAMRLIHSKRHAAAVSHLGEGRHVGGGAEVGGGHHQREGHPGLPLHCSWAGNACRSRSACRRRRIQGSC